MTITSEFSFISRLVLEDEGLLFSVLSFCEASARGKFLFLSKRLGRALTGDGSFRWRLGLLHAERGIYFPDAAGARWRALYLENLPRRHLWDDDQRRGDGDAAGGEEDPRRSRIAVCARLKPRAAKTADCDGGEEGRGREASGRVILPLHQRLSLIRMGGKLGSNREALRVLQLQGDWFAGQREKERQRQQGDNENQPSGSISGDGGSESTPGRKEGGDENAPPPPVPPSLTGGVHSIDHENGRLVVVDPTKGLREFAFDDVLPDPSSQEHVYHRCARGLVMDFINGSNATCLAYGQTGSGKTYTMFGPNDDPWLLSSPSRGSAEDRRWGIVPRALCELFEAIEYRRNNLSFGIEATVSMSYVEIYGDKVSDLLQDGAPCGHSQAAAQRYVLDGSAEKEVANLGGALELLRRGEEQKRTASTAMNERSSRAHTVLVLTLKQRKADRRRTTNPLCQNPGRLVESRLFLVDLGGSENIKKSRAGGDRERTGEAVNINLGLLALKKCAEALNSRSKDGPGRRGHVPYADSKLTMILSPGIGGDSRTRVIICAAQDAAHCRETLDTVAFGRSVGLVSNERRCGGVRAMLRSLLEDVDRGIAECGERIRACERWETREERIRDGYGKIESRRTTVLVGAEPHRLELERLLTRRAELTGTTIDQDLSSRIVGFGNVHEYISNHS